MLTTTKVKRGRWLRIGAFLVRVREFDHDDVVYESKACPKGERRHVDRTHGKRNNIGTGLEQSGSSQGS